MQDAVGAVLRVLFAALGLTAAAGAAGMDPSILAVVAAAALAVAILALHVAAPLTDSARSVAHPRRAIPASASLAQSDPDAPGHSRPRAPALAAPAA